MLRIRTFVPSSPPPGATLPDRQVQTTITNVAAEDGDGFLVENRVRLPTLDHLQWFWDRQLFHTLGTEVFADTKVSCVDS